MKKLSLKLVIFAFVIGTIVSCKSDDDGIVGTLNNAPVSEDIVVNMDENPTSDLVATIIATDIDGDTLTYSIQSQTPAGSIIINETTGEVFIADINAFDYEQNTVINASIVITDGTATTTMQLTINILDVNEVVVG